MKDKYSVLGKPFSDAHEAFFKNITKDNSDETRLAFLRFLENTNNKIYSSKDFDLIIKNEKIIAAFINAEKQAIMEKDHNKKIALENQDHEEIKQALARATNDIADVKKEVNSVKNSVSLPVAAGIAAAAMVVGGMIAPDLASAGENVKQKAAETFGKMSTPITEHADPLYDSSRRMQKEVPAFKPAKPTQIFPSM